jgi:hypothetical protein
MIIYEKWNDDNTELLNTIIDPNALTIEKMRGTYLLVVEPVVDPATEKKGDMTFTATERSWAVVAKTQEEQDEYTAVLAANAAIVAEDADIASAILSGAIGSLTLDQAKTQASGETLIVRRLVDLIWALLRERNRRLG